MHYEYNGQRVRVTFDGVFLRESGNYRAIQVEGDSVLMIPKHLTVSIGPTPWQVRAGDLYKRGASVYQILDKLDSDGEPTGELEAWETGSTTPVSLESLELEKQELVYREE